MAEGDPLDIGLGYLTDNAGALGLVAEDVVQLIVTDQYTDVRTGITHIYLQQTYRGLPVANAVANINVTASGEIINVGSSFVAGLSAPGSARGPRPALAATAALQSVADHFDWSLASPPSIVQAAFGADQLTVLDTAGISLDDIPARLHYVPTSDGDVELAWNITVRTPDGKHWYDTSVSALDGEMLWLTDWVDDATYNVFAAPLESPSEGSRTLEVDPRDLIASPFGWHDVDGVAGAEFTDTRGNNVFAQEDRNATDSGLGARPDGGVTLDFDFVLDLGLEPVNYQDAAITNLFYWNNILHDIHYQYGFDEVSGNFQFDNYSNGGLGAEPVQADAQYGADVGLFNNALFGTPPDGFQPQMLMLEFNAPTPNRDGDLDAGIIIHEYGHGVSNRLTGGPGNSGALNAIQSGGMGEGWGDWWGLMLTQTAVDAQFDAFPVGTYVLDQPTNGPGIRRFPYSFDMNVDPLTYDDFNGGFPNNEVHNAGEIWASALWDLNWFLINGDGGSLPALGFDADLYNGTGGNNLALQLVMDGLKLQPANPSFLDARDAILLADQSANGGANQLAIWTAFARRGMGFSADDGGSGSATTVVAAFDLPATSQGTIEFDQTEYEVGDPVTVTVTDIDLTGLGPFNLDVTSRSGDSESLTFIETALGVFEASVPTGPLPFTIDNGTLEVLVGDQISITYNDADDGTGQPAVVVDSADIIFVVPPGGDLYTISLAAGESIVITTKTPFDDSSATPLNDLDPELIVYGPSGTPVGSDENSFDGKNARAALRRPPAGTYTIQVVAESGTGEYLLSVEPFIQVEIDIRPGSDVNPINLKSNGVIPVAILGSDTFDVMTVDVTTLEFGPGHASPAHETLHPYEDVNEDGILDLVAHFRTQGTGITADDTNAYLTGALLDGNFFEGGDVLHIVGGDMNGDLLVNLGDVAPFVLALVNRSAFRAAFPLVKVDRVGDLDGNGSFDLGDLRAFTNLFKAASATASVSAASEPSATPTAMLEADVAFSWSPPVATTLIGANLLAEKQPLVAESEMVVNESDLMLEKESLDGFIDDDWQQLAEFVYDESLANDLNADWDDPLLEVLEEMLS